MSIHAVYQPVGCCDSATLNHLRGTLRFGGSKRQVVFSYTGWPVLPSGLGRRVEPYAGDNIVRLAAISFATQPALASPVSWISRPWCLAALLAAGAAVVCCVGMIIRQLI